MVAQSGPRVSNDGVFALAGRQEGSLRRVTGVRLADGRSPLPEWLGPDVLLPPL